jgi:hypothetical protein
VTPKATPLQSPGSEAPPPLSQDQIEFREEKDETIQKMEEVHGAESLDQPEQLPDVVKQTDVKLEVSLEESSSVTVESKPVAEEVDVYKEADDKAVQSVEPKVVQEDGIEQLETAEHPEHMEPEVGMTGTVFIFMLRVHLQPVLIQFSCCILVLKLLASFRVLII